MLQRSTSNILGKQKYCLHADYAGASVQVFVVTFSSNLSLVACAYKNRAEKGDLETILLSTVQNLEQPNYRSCLKIRTVSKSNLLN